MNQVKPIETFEETLLSHTEMCYSVALGLTHNPNEARELSRDVLIWAWGFRNNPDAKRRIKGMLLTELREQFLDKYAVSSHGACVGSGEESRPPMRTTA